MFNFISFYRQFKDQMKPVTSMPTLTVPAEPEVKAVIQPRLIDGLTQVQRVLLSMSDGKWRTLEEISDLTGDTTPSVSARLRDLRKPKFGAYTVDRRKVHESLYEYRVA